MVQSKRLSLGAALVVVIGGVVMAGPGDRSYVSTNTFLTLGGANCGFLKAVEGGGVVAEVILEPAGAGGFVKKHLGRPIYQEFTLTAGFGLDKSFYEWIAQTWKMSAPRQDGGVVTLDYNFTPKAERQFLQAVLTETTIPALDAASKDPGYLIVKVAPQMTRDAVPGGPKADYGASAKNEQKVFVPCNFKLQIDGLDCSKVVRVDAFTVRLTMVSNAVGTDREFDQGAVRVEFPNLRLLVTEAGAQPFLDWHKSFVVEGHNDDTRERGGLLTLLSPNLQGTLLRIRFYNLRILKAQPVPLEPGADPARKIEVELYVERMELLPGDEASGTTPVQTAPPAAPRVRRGA